MYTCSAELGIGIQNDHSNCHPESRCRQPGFSQHKVPLKDPRAIAVYENAAL